MIGVGALGFAAPLALLGLLVLPALWWLARAAPPTPKRVRFPAIGLLLGLRREEETPERTPLLLMLLRMAAMALAILAMANPIWRPTLEDGDVPGPLILVIDDGWAAAADWDRRMELARDLATEATTRGRDVLLAGTAPRPTGALEPFAPLSADAARGWLRKLEPSSWSVDRTALIEPVEALSAEVRDADVRWIADGLDEDGAADDFARALGALGRLTIYDQPAPWRGLVVANPRVESAGLKADAARASALTPLETSVVAYGRDGSAIGRAPLIFDRGELIATATFDLPLSLANDVGSVRAADGLSAAATALVDEGKRRRLVGLVDTGIDDDQPLLAGAYYLRRALEPIAEMHEAPLEELLAHDPSVILAPDVGRVVGPAARALRAWVDAGGVLVRFAGPRTASGADDLTPVALREGGRALGGALSWGEPQTLASVSEDGPFAGLTLQDDLLVRRQVLAQPSVDLQEKTWARLEDGTPLVTADRLGDGHVVLFHVTADPSWSDLPLTGLFPAMLERMIALSVERVVARDRQADAAPIRELDGFGALIAPRAQTRAIKADETPAAGPETPPGLYGGQGATLALNIYDTASPLKPLPGRPGGVESRSFETRPPSSLRGPALMAALALFLAEAVVASLLLGGGLRWPIGALKRARGFGAPAALVLAALGLGAPDGAYAQSSALDEAEKRALEATLETRLAYVKTGDRAIDEMSRQGLFGLSFILRRRTAAEPADPVAVDLETHDILYYPLLYWPITDRPLDLSPEAKAKVDRYLKSGGAVLFDTRDRHRALPGRDTAEALALRATLDGLDIPPLAPVPEDHVVKRSFYLINSFPGLWADGDVWVDVGARSGDGGDGVATVFIGSHNWAEAWALDENGRFIRGMPYRQREYAYRFGVNLVMYVLTGNYKRDQVHIKPLLERLGE